MNPRKDIKDELRELNADLPSDPGTQFSVPEGYFDGLAASIMSKIKSGPDAASELAELSPFLAGIDKKMPYRLPLDYFQSTIEGLPVLIREEENSLSYIGNSMPYEIPAGYFEQFPEKMLSRLPSAIKLTPVIRRRWMRMAVAAILTGVIALSGYLYLQGQKDIPVTNPEWIAKKVRNVSNKEIEEFVKTADVEVASKPATVQPTNGQADVEKMLQDVTDKELDAFLSQVPTEDDVFTDFN